jgi:Protein of unknown function (DUF1573)
MRTHIFALTLSIVICAAARAELKWERTLIELHPAAGDKEAVGHSKYQNTGNQPVRIKSVRTSCGCTAAQTQKDEVPPGDKGEITATFKIGDRTGTQVKNVTVDTDDPVNATTVLTLKAVIPQEIEINPSLVFWGQGEAPNPKTIVVRAGKDFPLKHLTVTSSNPDFKTKVEQAGTGEFKINVQPRETSGITAATLTIQPENSAKAFYATARVTNAPAIQ